MNVALADQIGAAASELDQRMREAAATGRWTLRDMPGPIVARLLLGWLDHPVTQTCPHLATPAPVIGYAWAPGWVGCGPCGSTLAESIRGTAEDTTCDGCKRYARHIHTGASALGPLCIAYGLCTRCYTADQHPTDERTRR